MGDTDRCAKKKKHLTINWLEIPPSGYSISVYYSGLWLFWVTNTAMGLKVRGHTAYDKIVVGGTWPDFP